MNLFKNLKSLDKLHTLILQEKTGSPKELAQQLGISRSTLYVLIEELSSLNVPIIYSRKYETFYYDRNTISKYKNEVNKQKILSTQKELIHS
jgi:predicted DNA-binding transcriptional regulator YafY